MPRYVTPRGSIVNVPEGHPLASAGLDEAPAPAARVKATPKTRARKPARKAATDDTASNRGGRGDSAGAKPDAG